MPQTEHTTHDESCSTCWCKSCRAYSTDGTRLGQAIAHTMGTTSELEILDMATAEQRRIVLSPLTGMTEEQADWEDGLEESADS